MGVLCVMEKRGGVGGGGIDERDFKKYEQIFRSLGDT